MIVGNVGQPPKQLWTNGIKPHSLVITVHQVVDVGGGGFEAITIKKMGGRGEWWVAEIVESVEERVELLWEWKLWGGDNVHDVGEVCMGWWVSLGGGF